MKTRTLLTPQQRREIAARELMPERTVLRTYEDPAHVKPSTHARVSRGASQLGYPPPPPREGRAA